MIGDQARGVTAQSMLDIRSRRGNLFPGELFSEFAWEMMLRLFVALVENRVMSEAHLIDESAVHISCGRRWINHLVHDKRVARQGSYDMILTANTVAQLREFLDEAKAIRDRASVA